MNPIRGEVSLDIGGASYRLCLTLGALARIEKGFGAACLSELEAKIAAPSAADFILLLTALLEGGGHDLSPEEVARLPLDVTATVRAIGAAFQAAGLASPDAGT